MKKIIFLFILCFSMSYSFGQDWQTVKSNQIHHFSSSDNAYTLSSRIDSALFVAGDSIFYSFQSPRFPMTDSCAVRITESWMGEKVIVEPDGTNLFFNRDKDTVYIETYAALNDTFVVYNYPSGEWVKGWVSSVDTATYLGVLDSVKTILLFSNHSEFDLITPRFEIGKTIGLITIHPFYTFPNAYERIAKIGSPDIEDANAYVLAGSENWSVGLQKPTIGEYFDHDIGDRFIYSTSTHYYASASGSSEMKELEVVAKTLWGSDSVEYTFKSTAEWKEYNEDYPELNSEGINSTTLTNRYYDLNAYPSSYLPEEWYDENPSDEGVYANWNVMGLNDCDRIEEQYHWRDALVYHPLDSSCLMEATLGWSDLHQTYVDGIGGGYFLKGFEYDGWGINRNGVFAYYTDTDGECGESFYVGTDEELSSNSIRLFPNPVNDQLFLESVNVTLHEIRIFDTAGREVIAVSSSVSVIDVSLLESGIYLLIASDGEQSYQEKFIKN